MTPSTPAETLINTAVKDYLPSSMLDWEGKMAAVLFMGGCNFACPYCHNPELVKNPDRLDSIPFKKITDYLVDKRDWIEGVVITGGEPTLTPGLKEIIEELRVLSLPVKLDTNGSHPDILEILISEGLLEYVSMDIKAVLRKYSSVTNSNIDPETINQSINLIIRSSIDHEFRTTAFPGAVSLTDLVEISSYLGRLGAKRYAIQQFQPRKTLDPEAALTAPYLIRDLERITEECNMNLPTKLR